MHEFDKMLKWVQEGGGQRKIEITIGEINDSTYLRKWAYDYSLCVGQSFKNIDEVDLQKQREEEEKLTYLKLKQKFEKGA